MTSAVADVTSGTIHASIEIDAPPDAVFDALIQPEQLAAWWGSADTYRTFDWKVDLRPGGEWSTQATSNVDGHSSTVRGKYLEIERPRLLVYTWQPSWEEFAETTIRVELSGTATGTRVRVTQTGFGERKESAGSHAEGWKRVLGWLSAHFARSSS